MRTGWMGQERRQDRQQDRTEERDKQKRCVREREREVERARLVKKEKSFRAFRPRVSKEPRKGRQVPKMTLFGDFSGPFDLFAGVF